MSGIPGEEKKERVKLQESLTSLDVGNNKIPTIELILKSLHSECDLVSLNIRGNLLREDISNRWFGGEHCTPETSLRPRPQTPPQNPNVGLCTFPQQEC